MVVQVRLDIPIVNKDVQEAERVAREEAIEMGVTVSRVKAREDIVQLYGTKERKNAGN